MRAAIDAAYDEHLAPLAKKSAKKEAALGEEYEVAWTKGLRAIPDGAADERIMCSYGDT